MCSIHKNKEKQSLSFYDYSKILRSIKNSYRFLPFLPVIWFSGGEVFTDPDFLKIIKYTKKMGFRYVVATNGTLIDDKVIKVMKKYTPLEVRVSIDGNEKDHDECRGVKGAYSRVIKSVELFKKNNMSVAITSIVSPHNKTVKHIVDLGKKLDTPVYFQHLAFIKKESKSRYESKISMIKQYVPEGFVFENYEDIFSQKSISDLWNELCRFQKNKNIRFDHVFNSKGELMKYYNADASIIDSSKLSIISTSAQVFPDGSMCGVLDKRLNLKNKSFAVVWNSNVMREYRKRIMSLGKVPRVPPITWV